MSETPTKNKGFVTDNNGDPSAMRLMSMAALLVAVVLALNMVFFSDAETVTAVATAVAPAVAAAVSGAVDDAVAVTVNVRMATENENLALVLYFLVAAFAPKAVQKFPELKYKDNK